MYSLIRNGLLGLGLAILGASPVLAQTEAIFSDVDLIHPVYAQHGMVATQEEYATRIGLDVLQKGGNAIDAGVASRSRSSTPCVTMGRLVFAS